MHMQQHQSGDPGPKPEQPLNQAVSGFVYQLSRLCSSGLPLLRSLQVLESTTVHPRVKYAVTDMVESIVGGDSLSHAMGKHEEVFEPVIQKLVTAGEIGGVLDIALERASELLDFSPPALPEGRYSDVTPEGRKFLFCYGTLIGMGVPILEATKVAGARSGGEIEVLAGQIHDAIREGESLSEALNNSKDNRHFGPVTCAMLAIGEETGEFDEMCKRAAQR